MGVGEVFRADKRRVAEQVAAALGRQHFVPVQLQGVAVDDAGVLLQGDAGEVGAEFLTHHQVHLVVGEPEGDLGDLGGEFFDFDAGELVHVHRHQGVDVEQALAVVVGGAQHVQFE